MCSLSPGFVAQQASADLPDLLSRVKELMQHEDFTLKNPNRLRSVVSSFASCQNKFHAIDGSGYKFIGDMVLEVDQLNPQVGGMALPKTNLSCLCFPARARRPIPYMLNPCVCGHASNTKNRRHCLLVATRACGLLTLAPHSPIKKRQQSLTSCVSLSQVASRLATLFSPYKRYDEKRQALMRKQLTRIRDSSPSKDTYEVASRCLG